MDITFDSIKMYFMHVIEHFCSTVLILKASNYLLGKAVCISASAFLLHKGCYSIISKGLQVWVTLG